MKDGFREDLLSKLGREDLLRIERAHIGLAGAGGLGSNCAMHLVRSGFKRLTIVDFDLVSAANLDRQFYFSDQVGMVKVEALKVNLLRINPGLEINAVKKKLSADNIKGIFSDCDAVVECFDRAEYKSMLVSRLIPTGKLIVSVSGIGGIGCSDAIAQRRLKNNFILIGDLNSDISRAPALSPRVGVAAAKQADAVLEFVIKTAVRQNVKK